MSNVDHTQPVRSPGGVLAQARKTWAVLQITVASRFAYVGELLVRSLFLVLILFIFAQLWRATNRTQNVPGLTGFSIGQLIWYLAFTESLILSAARGTLQEVDREVQSGDIAYRLARPLPYPLYHLGAVLADRLLRFVLNVLVGSVVALLVVGPITLTPLGFVAALSAAACSFVVDWVWSFTISLTAFWVENTDGLHLLYSRAFMILGGMLIPLDAYPAWLGNIARALPFQYLVYQPAQLFVRPDFAHWLNVLGVQLVLAGIALVPMLAIYRLGLRRVSAQGG